jgi:hypothetical protein
MNMKQAILLVGWICLATTTGWSEQAIRIGIGTQDTTINCAAGGAVVRELRLLEKYLPHDGKYQGVKYDIVWHNFTSGAPANSEMLANKLDITNMADFPAILGASAFQAANNGVKTYYIATLSGSTRGAGNAVVVPLQSKIQSFSELKGKRISVPFGSTAHAMLLRAIQDQGWDPESDVSIITQAPEVAGSALKSNHYDAQLKDYASVPFNRDALDTRAPVSDPKLAGQIWVQDEPTVRLYSSVQAALSAAGKLQNSGKKVRVVFAHDRLSGIKLFAERAWFVNKDANLSAFLLKSDADKWAKDQGGSVIDYADAQKAAANGLAGN